MSVCLPPEHGCPSTRYKTWPPCVNTVNSTPPRPRMSAPSPSSSPPMVNDGKKIKFPSAQIITNQRTLTPVLTMTMLEKRLGRFHALAAKIRDFQSCHPSLVEQAYATTTPQFFVLMDQVREMQQDPRKAKCVEHYAKVVKTLEVIFPENYVPMQIVPAMLEPCVRGKPKINYDDVFHVNTERLEKKEVHSKVIAEMGAVDFSKKGDPPYETQHDLVAKFAEFTKSIIGESFEEISERTTRNAAM
eukprot:676862-Rhodomonas_salina.1